MGYLIYSALDLVRTSLGTRASPYAGLVALGSSSNKIDLLMCSYLSNEMYKRTAGKIVIEHSFQHVGRSSRPHHGEPLQFSAIASFLSKLYSNCLKLLRRSGVSCSSEFYSLEMLRRLSMSQVYYMLGDNPKKMSYMVCFGNKYPTQVHHRVASIRWGDQNYSCPEGDRWLSSKEPNPNILYGAMVAGPEKLDSFLDQRKIMVHRATIASHADLVVALIALHDLPHKSSDSNDTHLGIDLLVSLKVFNLCHQLNVLQLVTNSRIRMKATKKINSFFFTSQSHN